MLFHEYHDLFPNDIQKYELAKVRVDSKAPITDTEPLLAHNDYKEAYNQF